MMRRVLFFLMAGVVPVTCAQAPPPQNIDVQADGRCQIVRPGDTVHYSLTIEGLGNVHTVFADLNMRPLREIPFRPAGLPSPDFRNLGGGGSATVDPSEANVFHFSFVVPQEIYSGRYRGVGVTVRSDEKGVPVEPAAFVDVTHHTMKQIRRYCLNVVSTFGTPLQKPEVTDFEPGLVVPKQ